MLAGRVAEELRSRLSRGILWVGHGCGTQPRKLREPLEGGLLHVTGQHDVKERALIAGSG